VAGIHERIACGDTYQVNYTFPLLGASREDPLALFARLVAVQRPRHAAYVDLGRFAVASASPELFFERRGDQLRTRPMKGTAARGLTAQEDDARAAALRCSPKERAENLMIVDMLRSDLGRVAELGSVAVPALFEVERYPTLLQLTSTVSARSAAPLSGLMRALFPCASVTGAPRESTMRLIAAHETAARGPYTGTLGWAGPGGSARWNVAIRTAVVDRRRGSLTFGVGSGIVADSVAAAERAECLLKARILAQPPFALLETLAWLPGEGFRRLGGHLARLAASSAHFGFPLDGRAVELALRQAAARAAGPSRARLLLGPDGRVSVELSPLPPPAAAPLRVGLARQAVDPARAWLQHKTTRREAYDAARATRPDCDEALLWNERGEATEASTANVVFEIGGERVTPPVACGLLPGVERARLLARGRAREGVVRVADLRPGTRLWLVSALRGEREAVLVR
jgi:para-aminobenzoate synthetase/4-amino-4-deoxychorismate lyase